MKAIVKENSHNNFFQNIKDFFSNVFGNNSYTNDSALDELETYRITDSLIVDELIYSSKHLNKQAEDFVCNIGVPTREKKVISKKLESEKAYTIKPIAPIESISKDSNSINRMDFSER